MRPWGLTVLLVSVVVLGGTFLATVYGPLSGGALSAIYIGYAALLGVGVILFALLDPRASLTPEQAARITATRKAADALATYRTGTSSGSTFRLERHRFYRNDSLNVEALEELLIDADEGNRRLSGSLLVAGGPEMALWAEDRLEELADLPNNQPLREALSRVARLARDDDPDDLDAVFR